MDIRLESMPFRIGGKEYQLRCNFNVLADVQEAYGGDMIAAMTENPMKSVLVFLASMLNDYADEMGWPERFTPKGVGRKCSMSDIPVYKIMEMVVRAITPPEADASPEEPGN